MSVVKAEMYLRLSVEAIPILIEEIFWENSVVCGLNFTPTRLNSSQSEPKNYICWFQGGIYAAHMGWAEEASEYTLKKLLHPHYIGCDSVGIDVRFPAFWVNPGFDHYPDMDHGETAMIGLQDQIMQTPGDKIYLLQAWNKEWDCDFKLNAPYATTVEGKIRDGKLTFLRVFPEERMKDVVINDIFAE